MKIKNKQSRFHFLSTKKFIFSILVILVVGLAAAYVAYNHNANDTSSSNRDDSAQTDSAKNDVVSDSDKNVDDNTSPSTSNNDTDKTADQPPASSAAATVTMASHSQQNHQVTTTVNITGENTSSTCTFTYSHQDAKPVVKQVKASNKICAATVPEVEFSMTGLWQLNVSLYNGSQKLAETNQNVTIN